MKKHIFGLAVFSFIVGAAAFVYALFNVSEIVPVYEVVSTPQNVSTEKTYCNKRQKVNSIEVRQAVLDINTKEFNWELAAPDRDEMIALHFFSKDERGTRYITTEQVPNRISRNGVLRFTNSYNWLNTRKSFENLYVIAQFDSDSVNYSENFQVYGNKFQPKFDATKAMAVTIDYGK